MDYKEKIIAALPFAPPFLFVDTIHHVSEDNISGSFYLDPELYFYRGHFKQVAVTPGVILTEIMVQTGLACFGIHLAGETAGGGSFPFSLSSVQVDFYHPVFPGETVRVEGIKQYFRFGKLKTNVSMYNEKGLLVCEGVVAGMQLKETLWNEG